MQNNMFETQVKSAVAFKDNYHVKTCMDMNNYTFYSFLLFDSSPPAITQLSVLFV